MGVSLMSAEVSATAASILVWGHYPMMERFYIFASAQVAAICSLALAHVQPPRQLYARRFASSPRPLTSGERWARATGAIAAAISGFERVKDTQTGATYQLDAADYTLQHILEDLAAVMPVPKPADGSELRIILTEPAEQESGFAVGENVIAA